MLTQTRARRILPFLYLIVRDTLVDGAPAERYIGIQWARSIERAAR